jgi:hypothetical protein
MEREAPRAAGNAGEERERAQGIERVIMLLTVQYFDICMPKGYSNMSRFPTDHPRSSFQ